MNEDDLQALEAKLPSWQPRRPSPALKWKLLLLSGRWLSRSTRVGGLLIPAAACVLLTVLNLSSNSGFSSRIVGPPLLAMSLSNQNAEIYWPALDGKGENCPPPQIFKWTNASSSPSSMRSRQSGIN